MIQVWDLLSITNAKSYALRSRWMFLELLCWINVFIFTYMGAHWGLQEGALSPLKVWERSILLWDMFSVNSCVRKPRTDVSINAYDFYENVCLFEFFSDINESYTAYSGILLPSPYLCIHTIILKKFTPWL